MVRPAVFVFVQGRETVEVKAISLSSFVMERRGFIILVQAVVPLSRTTPPCPFVVVTPVLLSVTAVLSSF